MRPQSPTGHLGSSFGDPKQASQDPSLGGWQQPGLLRLWALQLPRDAQRCRPWALSRGLRTDHFVLEFVFPGLSILTLTSSQAVMEETNCTPGFRCPVSAYVLLHLPPGFGPAH